MCFYTFFSRGTTDQKWRRATKIRNKNIDKKEKGEERVQTKNSSGNYNTHEKKSESQELQQEKTKKDTIENRRNEGYKSIITTLGYYINDQTQGVNCLNLFSLNVRGLRNKQKKKYVVSISC